MAPTALDDYEQVLAHGPTPSEGTDPAPEDAANAEDRVPNILGRLEPPASFHGSGDIGDLLVSGLPVPSPFQPGTMLRDFPFLPQQTGSQPMTEVESWFRQDSRLTHDD